MYVVFPYRDVTDDTLYVRKLLVSSYMCYWKYEVYLYEKQTLPKAEVLI